MSPGVEQGAGWWTYIGYALLWALVALMVFLFGRVMFWLSAMLMLPMERCLRFLRRKGRDDD